MEFATGILTCQDLTNGDYKAYDKDYQKQQAQIQAAYNALINVMLENLDKTDEVVPLISDQDVPVVSVESVPLLLGN